MNKKLSSARDFTVTMWLFMVAAVKARGIRGITPIMRVLWGSWRRGKPFTYAAFIGYNNGILKQADVSPSSPLGKRIGVLGSMSSMQFPGTVDSSRHYVVQRIDRSDPAYDGEPLF